MATNDITNETQPEKERESSETTSSGSYLSRPRRKLKPKTFSDDFYVFGYHRQTYDTNKHLLQNKNEGMHSHFSTSTPIKKSVNRGKGRKKLATTESTQADNSINNSSNCEQISQTVQQNETLPLEKHISKFIGNHQENHMNEILDKVTSDANVQDSLIDNKNVSCMSIGSEILSFPEENVNISSGNLADFENNASRELISLPKKHQSCVIESKNKIPSALDEHVAPDYRPDAVVSHNQIHGIKITDRNIEKMDSDSLSAEIPELCENKDSNENNNKHNVKKKNNLKKSVRKKPKTGNIDISCEDSHFKENRAHQTEKMESSELNNHNSSRNMQEEVGNECISHAENRQEDSVREKRDNTVDLDITSTPPIRNRETENRQESTLDEIFLFKGSTLDKMYNPFGLCTDLLPPIRKRGRPLKIKKALSQEIQTASPSENSITSLSQEIQTASLSDSSITPLSQEMQTASPYENSITPLSQEMQTASLSENSIAHLSQEIQTASLSESSITPLPVKRPRGRPPKFSTVHLLQQIQATSSSESSIDPLSQQIQTASSSESSINPLSQQIQTASPSENSIDSLSQQIQTASLSETSVTPVPVKRPRGRPPKNPLQKMKVAKSSAKVVKPSSKKISTSQTPPDVYEKAASTICQLCKKETKQVSFLKQHMMIEHSLIWSREYPQGIDSAYTVVKKVGHIDCQKCQKRFRNPQYYKHHQIWCGREDELATCEICNNTMRAMWFQQHLVAHRTQEKKLALEREKSMNKCEDTVQHDESDDDDGEGTSANISKKLKRKAANNAMKLMSSLYDTTEQEKASSSDGYSKESSGETSEDSDDFDDEEEDNDDGATKVKRKVKKSKPKKLETEKQGDSSTTEPRNIWIRACGLGANLHAKERLKQLHNFYARWLEGREFPELTPRKNDWEPLTRSEKEKYMPVNKESLKFTVGSKEDTDMTPEEHSLKIGCTVSLNGISYFYTGGSVWAIEWCPISEGAGHEQIVAISADITTEEPPNIAMMVDGPGLIQIWSTGLLENSKNCCAEPVFQYGIAHDAGYVRSISWCPKACFDMTALDDGCLKRLGLLAVGGSDGRVLIYCLPQPEELKRETQSGETKNVFRPQPALVLVPFSLKVCGPCLCVSWQPGGGFKLIAAGYGCGSIFMWNISSTSPLLKIDASTLRPFRSFNFHTLAVLSISWNPGCSSVFVSASYDFHMCVWNVNKPCIPIGVINRYTAHQIPRSVFWAGPLRDGFFSTCDKATCPEITPVCFHGLSKAAMQSTNLGVTVQSHTACTWDVNFSPFCDILATCDATGLVKIIQLSMNDVLTKGTGKLSWQRTQNISTDLYQAKIRSPEMSASSQPTDLLAAECSANLEKSAQNCQAVLSQIVINDQANMADTQSNPAAPVEMLHFVNSRRIKAEMKPIILASSESIELEDFGGSRTNAVHKVRLNPNMMSCLWLASGGQSGILRLDNLSNLSQAHSIRKFINKLKK